MTIHHEEKSVRVVIVILIPAVLKATVKEIDIEKQRLEQEIKNTEDHLKGLKNNKGNQKKQPNQTSSPKAGYGKIILAGAVIFSVVILASILIARTRKK
ncbi:2571_t:CDS:2, partial [Ambispora leptoticha]